MMARYIAFLSLAIVPEVAADSCCCTMEVEEKDCNEDNHKDKHYTWRASAGASGSCCRVRTKLSKWGRELEPGECKVAASFGVGHSSFITPINDLAQSAYSIETCERVCDSGRDCSSHGEPTLNQDGETCDCACETNFIGTKCDHKCDRDDDCSGHGDSFEKDGVCACTCDLGIEDSDQRDRGFIGAKCETACERGAHCSGHGHASSNGESCSCKCDAGDAGYAGDSGFIGATCETACDRDVHCSGKGHAFSSGDSCSCKCDAGYTGAQCDYLCTDDTDCNGHGVASSDGEKCTCKCKEAEDHAGSGATLSVFERAQMVGHGGHGSKKSLEKSGFIGEFCDHLCDADQDCNGHGAAKAKDGKCECHCKETFGGPQCGECAPGFGNYPKCEPSCTDEDIQCNNGVPAGTRRSGCKCECDSGFDPMSNCVYPLDPNCQKWGTFTQNCNVPRCKEKCCYFPREFDVFLGNHIPGEPVVVYGLCTGPDGSDGEARPRDVHGNRPNVSSEAVGAACNAQNPTEDMEYFYGVVRYPCGGYYVNYVKFV